LENVGIFFFSEVKTFHESPTQLLEIGGKLGEYKKCWDAFFFSVVKKRFILETGGKPKEIFLLKIGGKLRERKNVGMFFNFLQ
jgi:hypothetical protein